MRRAETVTMVPGGGSAQVYGAGSAVGLWQAEPYGKIFGSVAK